MGFKVLFLIMLHFLKWRIIFKFSVSSPNLRLPVSQIKSLLNFVFPHSALLLSWHCPQCKDVIHNLWLLTLFVESFWAEGARLPTKRQKREEKLLWGRWSFSRKCILWLDTPLFIFMCINYPNSHNIPILYDRYHNYQFKEKKNSLIEVSKMTFTE